MGKLEAALTALSSVDQDEATVRNGVGYNGRDTEFGNSLARQVEAGRTLTTNQRNAAVKMLKTYRTQLARDFQIDYDEIVAEIAAPVAPTAPARKGRSVEGVDRWIGPRPVDRPGQSCDLCGAALVMGSPKLFGKNRYGEWVSKHAACSAPAQAAPAAPAGERCPKCGGRLVREGATCDRVTRRWGITVACEHTPGLALEVATCDYQRREENGGPARREASAPAPAAPASALPSWAKDHFDATYEQAPASEPAPRPSYGERMATREAAAAEKPARSYEQVFGAEPAAPAPAAELPAVATATGLSVDGILGPGGVVAGMKPGYEHRPEQLEMANLVERAIGNQTHALIEAGTGTGKSFGYLVPAVNSGKKTIVATADKALQAQITDKDVPFLLSVYQQAGRPFTAVEIKGRSNYACQYRVRELRSMLEPQFKSPEAGAAWSAVSEWIAEQERDGGLADLDRCELEGSQALRADITVDSDQCLGAKCPLFESCFVERAKARAKSANIVIANYHLLLLDLNVRAQTEGHVSILPDADVVILDEAHHLEDIATDSFGTEVHAGRWNRLSDRLERLTVKHQSASAERASQWMAEAGAVSESLAVLFAEFERRLVAARKSTQRLGDELTLAETALVGLRALASRMQDGTPSWLDDDERTAWEKLAKATAKFSGELASVLGENADDNVVRYAELEQAGKGQRAKLVLKPIDVSDILRESLFGAFKTVIATSATIASGDSFDYWKGRVGCDEPHELIVGSPFDYPTNALLYLTEDEALEPKYGGDSLAYFDRLAAEYERLILASKGRAFALFTSRRAMNAVYERLSPRLRSYLVLRQGDAPRPQLVREFKENGSAVLFGVKSFWEGVDVQGDALSLVIIDKLPFNPPDDPVWDAKCEQIKRQYRNEWAWFSRLAIPVATIALKQGFGRLIRTRSDRGVVALLDARLTRKPYGAGIVRSLPPATTTKSVEAVKAFFGN